MDPIEMMRRSARVRELNDAFRTTFQDGEVHVTAGVNALVGMMDILDRVKRFNNFTEENDPHGEHDFGGFQHQGAAVLWKIDYYDLDVEKGSEDPADENKTTRVLTIMLAAEY